MTLRRSTTGAIPIQRGARGICVGFIFCAALAGCGTHDNSKPSIAGTFRCATPDSAIAPPIDGTTADPSPNVDMESVSLTLGSSDITVEVRSGHSTSDWLDDLRSDGDVGLDVTLKTEARNGPFVAIAGFLIQSQATINAPHSYQAMHVPISGNSHGESIGYSIARERLPLPIDSTLTSWTVTLSSTPPDSESGYLFPATYQTCAGSFAIRGEPASDNGPLSDSPSTTDVPATTTTEPASTTTTPPTTLPPSPPTEPAQTSTIPTSSADYTITGEPNLDSEVAAILDGAVAGAEQEYGFNVTDRECSDTDIGDLNASCGLTLDDGSYGLLDIYIAPGGNYSWEFFSD